MTLGKNSTDPAANGSRATRRRLYSSAVLLPGTLVDRYELVSPIGEGGMAQVWVARQRGKHGFEKLVAFKCIHPRFADDPAFRSMFLDEARIAASIEHPNVAQVFDLGEADSMLYLVMEYVDGESLGGLMTAASRRANDSVLVPTAIAMRVMSDACGGLQAAHTLRDAAGHLLGVVHRDVSPQNIIVSVRGDVKVIDFGIAHATDRVSGDTQKGALKGKLHYMAPEQAQREKIGPYTDVFAAGATLYRMLAGRPPFDGGNDAATFQRLLSGAPPDPLPEGVPPLVAAIVERAIARDPEERYVSAREMQSAIETAIGELRLVANVSTWVTDNLSDGALERRAALASRRQVIAADPAPEKPSFVAELGLPPERVRPPAPPPRPPSRPELQAQVQVPMHHRPCTSPCRLSLPSASASPSPSSLPPMRRRATGPACSTCEPSSPSALRREVGPRGRVRPDLGRTRAAIPRSPMRMPRLAAATRRPRPTPPPRVMRRATSVLPPRRIPCTRVRAAAGGPSWRSSRRW